MKPTVGVSIALSLLSSIAQAAAPDITSFLFDVSGSASSSFTSGSSGSGSFGPTTGVSVNSAVADSGYSGVEARTTTTAAGYVRSTLSGAFDPTPLSTPFSATTSGTWTGRFVNTLPTAQVFSLDVGYLNDASGNFPGLYSSHLFVGAKDYDLSSYYAGGIALGIGVLAPGQSAELKITTHAFVTLDGGSGSDYFGQTFSSLELIGYNASPVSPVPEPATCVLFVVGLGGLAWRRATTQRRTKLVV